MKIQTSLVHLTALCFLICRALAQNEPPQAYIVSLTLEQNITVLHLHPRFVSSGRKPASQKPAKSNALISTRSRRDVSLTLVLDGVGAHSWLFAGSKVNRYWIVPGLIRFNGIGDGNPQFPNHSLGVTYECASLVFALGGNRLLFQRKVVGSSQGDYFLAVLSADEFGAFDCFAPDWKADSVSPIAVSQCGARREAIRLMKPLDWVRTAPGFWQLKTVSAVSLNGRLKLEEDGVGGYK